MPKPLRLLSVLALPSLAFAPAASAHHWHGGSDPSWNDGSDPSWNDGSDWSGPGQTTPGPAPANPVPTVQSPAPSDQHVGWNPNQGDPQESPNNWPGQRN